MPGKLGFIPLDWERIVVVVVLLFEEKDVRENMRAFPGRIMVLFYFIFFYFLFFIFFLFLDVVLVSD